MRLLRITAPARDPVLLSEAKGHLRLSLTDESEDGEVLEFLAAAVEDVEGYTRRPLINQAWRLVFDRGELTPLRRTDEDDEWSADFDVCLPLEKALISAVTAVRAIDVDGVSTTLGVADYSLAARDEDATLYLDSGAWPVPLRLTQCLEVEVTAGYGADGSTVPAKLRRAIKQLVAYDFEHRGDKFDEKEREAILCAGNLPRVIRL